ncbi:type II secretion system protein [Candidatus Uhrbacteria bacterium]|nr:type II secretion system protein [Candidatus Uhrbacteria bacterium]
MYTPSLREENGKAVGFTLLELLIVIGIMVILGTVLVLVLNPAETLKKARDNQRISDMATMKTALGLYLTDVSSTDLDASVTSGCLGGNNTSARIFYSSYPTSGADGSILCTAGVGEGADVDTGDSYSATDYCYHVASPNAAVDGTGWLPVSLTGISGGSPLSAYPLDPTNTAMATTQDNTTLSYRYACQQGTMSGSGIANVFEIDAVLESTAYTSTDNKLTKDGGDNTSYYEVGNNLKLLPTTTNF